VRRGTGTRRRSAVHRPFVGGSGDGVGAVRAGNGSNRSHPAPAGLTVRLTGRNGSLIASGNTDSAGRYLLTDLPDTRPTAPTDLEVVKGTTRLGNLVAPRPQTLPINPGSLSIADIDLEIGPYDTQQSLIVEGTVNPGPHTGHSTLTITAPSTRPAGPITLSENTTIVATTTRRITPANNSSGWQASPANLTAVGHDYRYTCPASGTVNEIWGTGTYTNDSSVCTAAVHAGFITVTHGGSVVTEIRPGLSHYEGSDHDGMTSQSYGKWATSFVFIGSPTQPSTDIGFGDTGWDANATDLRGKIDRRYDFICPRHGAAGDVYGTGTYTDDSSVCTAAVHAGLITLAAGGTVVIETRPGASSYTGSTQNGITSNSYDA